MDIEFGVLAATASSDALLEALRKYAHAISVGEQVTDPTSYAARDQSRMAIGEYDGRAYVYDGQFALTDKPDLIVALSERLGTVAGCGADAVSGSFWLTVGQNGQLRRRYWMCHTTLTRPVDLGEPFTAEAVYPIEDDEGAGLFAVLDELGFRVERWLLGAHAYRLVLNGARFPNYGPIRRAEDDHYHQYAIVDHWLAAVSALEQRGSY